jgi:hypothetical protein
MQNEAARWVEPNVINIEGHITYITMFQLRAFGHISPWWAARVATSPFLATSQLYLALVSRSISTDTSTTVFQPRLVARLLNKRMTLQQRAMLLHGSLPAPVRSAVLVPANSTDAAAMDHAHIARITWVLSSLLTLDPSYHRAIWMGRPNAPAYQPEAPLILDFKTVSDANATLSQVNNVGPELCILLEVLRTYLTWVLQTTDDLHDLGVEPHETPDILARNTQVREINRSFAKRMANPSIRNKMTPDAYTKAIAKLEADIRQAHSPMSLVLGLTLSDVDHSRLLSYMGPNDSPFSPDVRRQALRAFKRALLVTARAHEGDINSFDMGPLVRRVT